MINPKISIIVPIFNPRNLDRCINSILNQTMQDIQVILINDGSKNYVKKEIEKLTNNDQRVIVVNQKNQGTSAARNKGFSLACGEYVTFVDHDDWIEKDLYEKAYLMANKYDTDIVQWGYSVTTPENSNEEYFGPKKEGLYLGDNAKLFFFVDEPCWPPVWRRLYKTSIIRNSKILFDTNLKCGGEDASFNISLLPYINRVYDLNKPLYHWCRAFTGVLYKNRTVLTLLDDLCARAERYADVLKDLRCRNYNLKKNKSYTEWAYTRVKSLQETYNSDNLDNKIFSFINLAKDVDTQINNSEYNYKLLKSTPIDVIYTYADVTDPAIMGLDQNYPKNIENEEIRYSIRSILKNIPWIRKIFIFMPNNKIKYLKDKFSDNRIVYVTDNEILGFNTSSVITKEFNLWKLKNVGCSENVIYLNDDYFIGRPLNKSDFFYIDNDIIVPYVFYRDSIVDTNYNYIKEQRDYYYSLAKGEQKHTPELYYTQLLNGHLFLADVLNKKSLRLPVDIRKTMHNAQGFNLSELEEIYYLVKNNYKYSDNCLNGLRRDDKQLTAPVFYDYYFLNKKNRKINTIDYAFIDLANVSKYRLDYSLFCVNTGNREYSEVQKKTGKKFLNLAFNNKSPYEK